MENVSPALTVLGVDNDPNQRLVPVESYSSTPTTVQAGMLVYTKGTFEVMEPLAGAAKVTVWRA
jgi:hypothetical protein